ncbi:MAG: TRAP transporter substrate-binding protein DctP [Proteobacteria bacterium]|nr:TRAP transporter substrate-binding protein DctP [Pseudomonadota bacterium]MBI3496592.1 TRAP transporter substrate-binding protein DctP [Pseudomonadota bacterium]
MLVLLAGRSWGETLRASHQWPVGTGDFRDQALRLLAREAAVAKVGLDIKVSGASKLFKPRDQWTALQKGQLDIALLPLSYGGVRDPSLMATFMPGVVRSHDQAARLDAAPFMQVIRTIAEVDGVIILSNVWVSGGIVSRGGCVREPKDLAGRAVRVAGRFYELMAVAAGATRAELAPPDLYGALQTGLIEAVMGSSDSLVQLKLYEQAQCLTAPDDKGVWFLYEPIVMAKETYERLSEVQQKALIAAATKAEAFAMEAARAADQVMIDTYRKNGVEVTFMTVEEAEAWRELAISSAHETFKQEVPAGAVLLDLARRVQ